jgi:hypothetical protein
VEVVAALVGRFGLVDPLVLGGADGPGVRSPVLEPLPAE